MNNFYVFLSDYIRLMCYALIIVLSLKDIAKRKITRIFNLTDIIIAGFFGISLLLSKFCTQLDKNLINSYFLTPLLLIWTGIKFNNIRTKKGV